MLNSYHLKGSSKSVIRALQDTPTGRKILIQEFNSANFAADHQGALTDPMLALTNDRFPIGKILHATFSGLTN
jgi:hypothetical protein